MADAKKKTTVRKDQDFRDLCKYIEKEILRYDDCQKLQKQACLRLKGLQKGKLIANNKIEDNAFYSFDVILNTFKMYRLQIVNAMRGKKFESEFNQINYACAIVENHINDMYCRMRDAQKAKEKTQSVEVIDALVESESSETNSDLNTSSVLYTPPVEQTVKNKERQKKFEDLW